MGLIMKTLASTIAFMASNIQNYWADRIKDQFGIKVSTKESGYEIDPTIIRQLNLILSKMPTEEVKDCKIFDVYFSFTMGPNLPHYPNHGYYINNSVTLNVNIFTDPDQSEDFLDEHGYAVNRATHTVIHEFGHGYDQNNGDLSLQPEWLQLSGWSKDAKPGLKRLVIKDPGAPVVIGEWFFDPRAGFVRFYAKRNPYDDFADSFAFYVAGLQDKLPENKRQYFQKLLLKYS
jgi:hypothetical protein